MITRMQSLFLKRVNTGMTITTKKFSSMDETREWVLKYNHWYNFIHKHSGIKFVTTHQRHAGLADKILAKKKRV